MARNLQMHRGIIACILLALMAQAGWAEGQTASCGIESGSDTDYTITPCNVQNNEVFNMVVIGDSIAWGAGLNGDEKYSYLVAKWIAEQSCRPVNVKVLAHTGATLKKKTTDPELPYPDIPSSNPTLFEQLDKISNPHDVDLVLVSGGANDVDLKKLNSLNINWVFNHVFGGSTLNEIQTQSWDKIETPMYELLKILLNKCPNSKIIVTGYYSAISTDSRSLTEFYKALEPMSQWVDEYRNADNPKQLYELATKADTFYAMSNLALNSAKSRANRESGQNRIEFAQIVFPPDKSYGTDDSWLWKIEGTEGNYRTDDHKYDIRAPLSEKTEICEVSSQQLTSPLSNYDPRSQSDISSAVLFAECEQKTRENKLAAVGHPNVEGAGEYNRTIAQKISETWPDWLHPIVLGFEVSPPSLTFGESFKINYNVSSNCSEGLRRVELWRKNETRNWREIKRNIFSGEIGPVSGSFTDSPSAPGKYWYGVHVVDNAGNWNDQKNSNTKGQPKSFEPVEVEVKSDQETAITSPIRTLNHGRSVLCIAFSPNGQIIASGGEDDTIKLWDVSSGSLIRTLEGHSNYVTSVAFSPDGQTIASGSWDKTIKLWDTSSGKLIRTIEGRGCSEESVAFSPDGHMIASVSFNPCDNPAMLWDVSSGELVRYIGDHDSGANSVAFSPDGHMIAAGGEVIMLYSVSSGLLLRMLEGHNYYVTSVAFSSDGHTIASGSRDETVKLWNASSGSLIRTLNGHIGGVECVAFSLDGRTIASGGMDYAVKVWDVSSGSLLRTLEGYGYVKSVAFSPDSRTIASAGHGGEIHMWSIG